MLPTKVVFQVFRAVTVDITGHSTTLGILVSGGVLQSAIWPVLGPMSWVTTLPLSVEVTEAGGLGFASVASKIRI